MIVSHSPQYLLRLPAGAVVRLGTTVVGGGALSSDTSLGGRVILGSKTSILGVEASTAFSFPAKVLPGILQKGGSCLSLGL